ncbi:MAG: HAMP domain-containing protein [Ferruginibacter sp.]|nr:HAMP domain-containing protein [Ferruginibacter sp.]
MKLKTKLVLGLSFLFVVIVTFGSLSFYYINRLSNDSKLVLKNNHESLVYSNNMLDALENIQINKGAEGLLENNLRKQESNITEIGEKEATQELRKDFRELLLNPGDSSNYPQIRHSIHIINGINQAAILRKNEIVEKTAEDANFWLTIVFVVLGIITFTFVINFPSVISAPIRALNEGIREIANRNYHKRIHLNQNDEFGELANAFNTMAEKLDEYQSSNLAQLRFEKSRIETIINQMRDGIIGLDTKKNILFLNAVAEKLLGLKEAEIIGKYSADVALRNDLMRKLLQETPGNELKIYADNKESYFNKDILDVTNNGLVVGQVIVLRNITPFHELNEAKTNFIATVSHELKTPISSIKMSARLLEDERIGKLVPEQAGLVKSIMEDAERLLKITSELLNMAQVETGNIQLKLQPAQPGVIVDQSVNAIRLRAGQKNIALQINIPQNLPLIQADIEKTSWVLINLLTNAIKYSPENSPIQISVSQKNNSVEFTVKDSGNGIDEKYLPKIFDRYYKVPGTHERTGTGLGLAISREFIEAQQGTIWAQSTIGEGSVFGFSLQTK